MRFDFTNEDEAKNYDREKRAKKKEGWLTIKSNGHLWEFCCEKCRDSFIKEKT